MTEVERDLESRIGNMASQTARLRAEHRLTRDLIRRSLEMLQASRTLLSSTGGPATSKAAAFRAEALRKAQQHVKEAGRHVARQQLLVDQLRKEGRESDSAERLLRALEMALTTYQDEMADLCDPS